MRCTSSNLTGMSVLSNIRIVLVEPRYSGNIGSVCRAMANMGISDLTLVAPRVTDGWEEGERMACHANELLRGRRECATLEEAVGDCAAVAGATARLGLYRQHVRTPRELAPELLQRAATGRVALLFGREDNGLGNDEIARCTHLLRIPTGPDYISLNLAQAVMICCYELFVAEGSYEAPDEKSAPVEARQRERLQKLWRETMLMIGFMKDDKADHMMQGFQRIFSRGVRTADDAHIMMGVARQTQWAARRQPKR
ncbi:MAG: RNA methyltransferase [Kiritimatiellae bacterium]|nr:RNA methyltransferase [Kiritimatiellia bacterium]